jgi:NAD(P)-dependent dehydrogenase (short-subunit alcohol dehydrogenase family)
LCRDHLAASSKILVTGAAGGIGEACVTRYRALGAEVLAADIDTKDSERAYKSLDVTDPNAWTELVDRLGPFGVAHFNAGVMTTEPGVESAATLTLSDISDSTWRRILSINLDGVFYGLVP